MQHWLKLWANTPLFTNLKAGIQSIPGYRASVQGVDPTAGGFLIAGLAGHLYRPILLIAADASRAEEIYEELLVYFPRSRVHLLPPRELFVTGDLLSRSSEPSQQRLHFLNWAISGKEGIYVASLGAVFNRSLPPDYWRDLTLKLEPEQRVDRDYLVNRMAELGYYRVPLIEGKGQFSVRGEILDIFPPEREEAIRLELFDDTIASLRSFDYRTQRSTGTLPAVNVSPAFELILTPERYREKEGELRREAAEVIARLARNRRADAADNLQRKINRYLERLGEPEGLEMLPVYFSYFYGPGASPLHYLSRRSLIILDEPARLADQGGRLRRELEDHYRGCILQGEFLPDLPAPVFNEQELLAGIPRPILSLSLFPGGQFFLPGEQYSLEVKGVPHYYGQWELFQADVRGWLQEGYRVALLAANSNREELLQRELAKLNLPVTGGEEEGAALPERGQLKIAVAGLDSSFILPSLQLVVISERNLVPRRRKKRALGRRQEGIHLRDYRELSAGDYVVHEQHGIGKYLGLTALEVNGLKKDYLQVKYRGTDRLYIPVDQIQLIQKYIGSQGKVPTLHSLGGGEWSRLKSRVSSSIREMAGELLSIYARRQASTGYAFGPDHPWQQEFEDRFPYEETPDQLQAIAAVKRDLEKPQPMDRLICGDVGYGKTEVALRASFKVALEGKQVALLVPTTILAQQHYRTFEERLADFPLKVAQISRFVSPSRQKEILKQLARGEIDIIIGTHRLLSKDVKFSDLGLLIIDEEQRFGVRHKERLKKMRLEVDVLTMTATPIPRTLHLSIVGVRDLSVIETPPENRYPVQTFVVEHSDQLIIEAIQREIKRQGQVYYVFNRVRGINAFAEYLSKLVPQARIAVGHGQMAEARLEQVMSDFLDQKYDVLVSTTIVEAGLDIPNVNTMIIHEADKFGLAQLYQLRGRVGRSNRLAYAFLTYNKDKILTGESKKRLQAIKDFTELGSGFKIALKDLEIRGAGNILGAEQHGFMVAVGFDLYCRLLEEAIADLKQEKREKPTSLPTINLKVSAFIPGSYIVSQDQKIDFYQRIYASPSEHELTALEEELKDRYGALPLPVINLLGVARLRGLALEVGVGSIEQRPGGAAIRFNRIARPDPRLLRPMVRDFGVKITLPDKNTVVIKLAPGQPVLPALIEWLSRWRDLVCQQEPAATVN
ncbi:MAG: transcription-repair coupling factor [Firmicutes bacterium]|nr:transcription-repair coupling factor [Bacillota bacterium]